MPSGTSTLRRVRCHPAGFDLSRAARSGEDVAPNTVCSENELSWIAAAYVATIAIGLRIAFWLHPGAGRAAFRGMALINGKQAGGFQRCVT
jgi:hypothetical protein